MSIAGGKIMSDDKIKDALNMLPYGFYAVGSKSDNDVNIMVANWIMQSSFSPRQVTFALAKKAHTHQVIGDGGVFSVNIFNKDDTETIKNFSKSREKNPDKVSNARYSAGAETGCPIVEGAAAWLECRVVNIVDSGGDHDLIVGEVVGAGVNKDGEPSDTLSLLHIGWSYAG
jgi:flavin reductase (DIM6/NTAB) family NADH-FMN oxidoreductase RutF